MDEQGQWSPLHIGNKKERTIILISAIVGIIAFIFILRKQNAAAPSDGTYSIGSDTGTAYDLAGSPSNLGASYGAGGSSLSDLQAMIDSSIAKIGPAFDNQIDIGYTADNSTEYSREIGAGGGGNKGGFGISMFGGTFGVSGGSRAVTPSDALNIRATDKFSTTTSLMNASPDTLASVQNFLKIVGGTADERMQHQSNVIAMGEQSSVGLKTDTAINPIYNPKAS